MIPRKSYLSASRPPTLVPYASPSHPDGGSRWLERDPNPVTREFQEFHWNFLGNGFTALLVGSPLGPYQGPTRAPCRAFARWGVPGPAGELHERTSPQVPGRARALALGSGLAGLGRASFYGSL